MVMSVQLITDQLPSVVDHMISPIWTDPFPIRSSGTSAWDVVDESPQATANNNYTKVS